MADKQQNDEIIKLFKEYLKIQKEILEYQKELVEYQKNLLRVAPRYNYQYYYPFDKVPFYSTNLYTIKVDSSKSK